MCRDNSTAIPSADLYAAARRRILQKLVDLALSKLSFLQSGEDTVDNFSILKPPKGKEVKGDEVRKKAMDFGMDELQQKLSVAMDPVLSFAIGALAADLEGYRSTAASNSAVTMEVFLGRLPYMRALLFRNTFFPVWDLIVNQVFGNIGGPLQQFLNSSSAFMGSVANPLNDVRDKVHRAQAVEKKYEEKKDVSVGTDSNIGEYEQAWDQGGSPPDQTSGPTPKMQQDFPIQGRSTSAGGKIIKQGEWKSVTMIADIQFTEFPPKDPPAPPPAAPKSSGLPSLPF